MYIIIFGAKCGNFSASGKMHWENIIELEPKGLNGVLM